MFLYWDPFPREDRMWDPATRNVYKTWSHSMAKGLKNIIIVRAVKTAINNEDN